MNRRQFLSASAAASLGSAAVSYTHLDVYKRQLLEMAKTPQFQRFIANVVAQALKEAEA